MIVTIFHPAGNRWQHHSALTAATPAYFLTLQISAPILEDMSWNTVCLAAPA
jgi:hypothetical protein